MLARTNTTDDGTRAAAVGFYLVVVLFAALFGAELIALAAVVRRFDLLHYPFTFPDTWDWLANATAYAGHPVTNSWRPPLTALLQSALIWLGRESAALALGPVWFLAGSLLIVRAGSERHRVTGLTAGCLYLASHLYFGNALYVGNDVLAATLILAVLVLGAEREARPTALGVVAGLALLATPAAALALALSIAARCVRQGRIAVSPLARTAVALLLTIAPYYVYKVVAVGSVSYSTIKHIELVNLHADKIPYYLASQLCRFSPPIVVLALLGIVTGLWNRHRAWTLYWLAAMLAYQAFFVLLYDWRDNRFLLYWGQPVLLLAAAGLNDLLLRRMNTLRIALHAALLVLVCVWSSSGFYRHGPVESSVWLWPGRVLRLTGSGGRLELGDGDTWPMPAPVAAVRHARAVRRSPNPRADDLDRVGRFLREQTALSTTVEVTAASPGEAYQRQGLFSFLSRRTVRVVADASETPSPGTLRVVAKVRRGTPGVVAGECILRTKGFNVYGPGTDRADPR